MIKLRGIDTEDKAYLVGTVIAPIVVCMIKLRGIDTEDKAYLVGTVIAPIVVWWIFFGRKKYGVGGMK